MQLLPGYWCYLCFLTVRPGIPILLFALNITAPLMARALRPPTAFPTAVNRMRKLARLMSAFWTWQLSLTIVFIVVSFKFFDKDYRRCDDLRIIELQILSHQVYPQLSPQISPYYGPPDKSCEVTFYGQKYALWIFLASVISALMILFQLWRLYFSTHRLVDFITIESSRIALWWLLAWYIQSKSRESRHLFDADKPGLGALTNTVMCKKMDPTHVGMCGLEMGRSIWPGSWNATSETLEMWAIKGALVLRHQNGFLREVVGRVAPYPSDLAVAFGYFQ